MGHVYILKLRNKKWYVGYTERSSIDRILEHIDEKGAKWTKRHPPLKKGYLHSFSKPGRTKRDEDKETLALMKKHGIANVRGGRWCMVNMPKGVYAELSSKIGEKPPPKAKSKRTAKKSVNYDTTIYKKDQYGRIVQKNALDFAIDKLGNEAKKKTTKAKPSTKRSRGRSNVNNGGRTSYRGYSRFKK